MKHAKIFLLIFVFVGVGALLFAGGQQEAGRADTEEGGIQFIDEESDDIVLRTGLPSIKTSGEASILTVWRADAAKKGVYKFNDELIKKYYPDIEMEWQFMSMDKIVTVVSSRLTAGNPPVGAAGSIGMTMVDFAKEDTLIDLTDIWDKYGLEEVFPESIARLARYNDRYYAIPVVFAPHAFFWWNKSLFEEAGIEEPPYETWNEYFAAAEEFNQKMDVPFLSEGLVPNVNAFYRMIYLGAKRYGIEIAERVFNGEATKEDFENMLTFYKKYLQYAGQAKSSLGLEFGPQERVATGNAATCVLGHWARNAFAKQNMTLDEDYAYAHLPGSNILKFNVAGFIAYKGSGKEDLGKAVASLCATRAAQLYLNEKGTVPCRSDVSIDPEIFPHTAIRGAEEMQTATLYPNPSVALPAEVSNTYPPEVVGYVLDKQPIEETVQKLIDLQEKYKDQFVKW